MLHQHYVEMISNCEGSCESQKLFAYILNKKYAKKWGQRSSVTDCTGLSTGVYYGLQRGEGRKVKITSIFRFIIYMDLTFDEAFLLLYWNNYNLLLDNENSSVYFEILLWLKDSNFIRLDATVRAEQIQTFIYKEIGEIFNLLDE